MVTNNLATPPTNSAMNSMEKNLFGKRKKVSRLRTRCRSSSEDSSSDLNSEDTRRSKCQQGLFVNKNTNNHPSSVKVPSYYSHILHVNTD